MCGIAGLIDPDHRFSAAALEAGAGAMADAIRYRGPDDRGTWADGAAGVAFGHRRLAIIDLSPAGHQPMASADGRYVITYNGEIYNFPDLRAALEAEGCAFRGHSDTEVLVAAISAWGVEEALRRSDGMFAFAVWDRRDRTLTLARDRVGEKPLYFGWSGGLFRFASELKALAAGPGFSADIDRDALTLLLRHGYIPAPYSVYRQVYKLPAGTMLRLDAALWRADPGLETLSRRFEPYWSARAVVEAGRGDPFRGTPAEAVDALEEHLRQAVASRMVSDVPIGAFLSGGIDSSVVVALMQAQSSRPVRTFSIGFHEAAYNEAEHAKAVAQHLGTDHTELYVRPDEARDVIPRLPTLYDEPFADSSQIPTYLVSALARRHVTVSLSGDGGDELFGGYNRYAWTPQIWGKMRRMPAPARRLVANGLTSVSPPRWNALFAAAGPVLPAGLRQTLPGDKLHKLAQLLRLETPEALYHRLVSLVADPEEVVVGSREPATHLAERAAWPEVETLAERMMYLDLVTYLPDDILVKVDRASMAVSLESRIPLLAPEVIDFAWRLPLDLRIRDGQSKWALRQVLYKYVPSGLIDRPKMGFGVPIETWLRGPLRDWAEALLDERRLRREGFFEPQPVRKLWDEHLSGRHGRHYELWNVLMFQAWHEAQHHDDSQSRAPAEAAAYR